MSNPHAEGERWVAQEGPFSAATADVAVLHYFPVRGRAEPIRLALALCRQPWFEPPVSPLVSVMRHQLDSYPFRQLPRYLEGRVDLVQSMAILRHLGRKHGLYGSDLDDAAQVDMVLDAVADLRAKLKTVWVTQGLSPDAVSTYTSSVLAPEEQLCSSSEKGPGLACLERLLSGAHRQWPTACDEPPEGGPEALAAGVAAGSNAAAAAGSGGDLSDAADVPDAPRRGGGAKPVVFDESLDGGAGLTGGDDDGRLWLVGDRISIADIAVADLVDMHLSEPQVFEGLVRQNFPHLVLLRRRVMGQPGIKEYLASNNRHELIWGVQWKPSHTKDADKMAS